MHRYLKRFLKYFLYAISATAIVATCFVAYLLWFQPPFYFPKPTGQYAVGVKDYHWIDTKRKETLADDPAHPYRELMVSIWYPTTPSQGSWLRRTSPGTVPEKPATPYAPYLTEYERVHYFWTWLLLGLSRPIYSYAQPDALLATDKSTYPVVIFSHGFGLTRDSNTAQCEELASHGYIVVGISHTYDSSLVKFPDGRIVCGTIQQRCAKNKDFIDDPQTIETWISDVRFVLEHIERLTEDQSSLFYKHIDRKNIGIFGHSFGGGVAVQLCRRDPRIKAGVAFEGVLYGPDATKGFDKPFMFMLAGKMVNMYARLWAQDDWKKFGITSQEEELKFRSHYLPAIEKLTQPTKHDAYIFVVKDAEHMTFCDNVVTKHAPLFSRFLGNLGTGVINGFKATEVINAYLINFFDKYLKGKSSELLDGKDKKYPEVEMR